MIALLVLAAICLAGFVGVMWSIIRDARKGRKQWPKHKN